MGEKSMGNYMTDQANPQSTGLHVITLISSTAPITLPQFRSPRLDGLAVFRSRRVEDGRERYRIHLGYFTSAEEAEEVLPIVRETYPWAFVGPAPQSNLGSLDDTANTRFTVLRTADLHTADLRAADQTAGRPASSAITLPSRSPVTSPVTPPAATPAPAARSTVPLMAPPPARAKPARVARPPAAEQPAVAAKAAPPPKVVQRYAVQLIWSRQPIDVAKIPHIGMFRGYLLYAVETTPGSHRMYGVRLGFYDDELSARLVALYVRPTFKAIVVPVSEREVSHASGATIRLSGSRPARGRITPLGQWPQAAVAVNFLPAAKDTATPQL